MNFLYAFGSNTNMRKLTVFAQLSWVIEFSDQRRGSLFRAFDFSYLLVRILHWEVFIYLSLKIQRKERVNKVNVHLDIFLILWSSNLWTSSNEIEIWSKTLSHMSWIISPEILWINPWKYFEIILYNFQISHTLTISSNSLEIGMNISCNLRGEREPVLFSYPLKIIHK